MRDKNDLSVLDILLEGDAPDVRRTRRQMTVEIPRLTEATGATVVFQLSSLTYNGFADVRATSGGENFDAGVVERGIVDPVLSSPALLAKYSAAHAGEVVRGLLMPGEIKTLSQMILDLSGYDDFSVVAVKND